MSEDGNKRRKSFAERRQTIQLQMEKMVKEVKTKYRKRFVFTIVLCIILIIAFIVTVILMREKDEKTCETQICQETAEQLYSNMNTDVDPCDDFYEFACGGWVKNNPRPKDKGRWNAWYTLGKNVIDRMIHLLESNSRDDELEAVKKAKSFYKSCKNMELRNSMGDYEMRRVLNSMGGLPIINKLDTWNATFYDWQKGYIYYATKLGFPQFFFGFYIGYDIDTNYTTRIIQVYQTTYEIGTKLLNENLSRDAKYKIENEYRNLIRKRIEHLKPSAMSHFDLDFDELIIFEKKLANATFLRRNKTDAQRKMTIYQMEYSFPHVNWYKIFKDIFHIADIRITKDEPILVSDFYYFSELGNILNYTSKRTIANYIGLKVLDVYGTQMIPKFREIGEQKKTKTNVNEQCFRESERYFYVVFNYLYIKHHFKNESLQELKEFVKHLKASLTLTLQQNEWMDDETKLRAQLKLNKMLDSIGAPSWVQNEYELNEFYADTDFISSENYYSASRSMYKWQTKQRLRYLKYGDEKRYVFSPTIVNAFYQALRNNIALTAGILQPPMYYDSSPIAMNFAGIGFIIGHEITHGFDDSGSTFDEKGAQINWWKNDTREKFEERVNCFKKQYSQYTEPATGKKLNGSKTVGDDIADNGGLQQAFRAYKIYTAMQDHSMDLKLPSKMERFTRDQLFFISYANVWCGNDSPDFINQQLRWDVHSPRRFRVIVPLTNSETFANTFQCKPGSAMNPIEKCVLW